MAQGYHDFTAGEVLTAANLEDYCQNQSVMRFASSAARDSALASVLTEGLLSAQTDSNSMTAYSGAAWSTVGPLWGAWTSWTPVVTQSNTPTLTNNSSGYVRIGRLIIASFAVTLTSAGTVSNDVVVSLPVTARGGTSIVNAGYGTIEDVSVNARYSGACLMVSTTTFKISSTTTANTQFLGSATSAFTAALASGDFIYGQLMYEAAGDA